MFQLEQWRRNAEARQGRKEFDFADWRKKLLELFVGRGEQARQVADWAKQTSTGICWIGGHPGVGKSAFMADLAERFFTDDKQYCKIVHFFRGADPRCNRMKFLGNALTSLWASFGKAESLEADPQKRGNQFRLRLAEISREQAAEPEKQRRRIVFLLDGVDEALQNDREFAELIFENRLAGVLWTMAVATHKFLTSYSALTGLFTQAQPADADLAVTDVTTNNVSTSAHGFVPKAPNDVTKLLDGTGNYSAPVIPAALGGAVLKTAGYAAVSGDNGKILSFNSASPVTLTLPSPPPSAIWNVEVQNVGAGVVTVSPNGLTLDSGSSSLTLAQSQGLYISTDGTNYYTERGLGTVSPLTTQGDILAFSTVPARQGVGANGTCLQADSSQSTGIRWALQPYDITFVYPGGPPNATVLQLICFSRAVAMSGNFAGSTGHCGGNPTSTAVFAVYKNGSPIGTVTIATSVGFTFATTGGASQTFVAGDTLTILTPATDATLSSVTITFAGTR